MALITEEFSGECFDFDPLFASCLGGLVLRHAQKEVISRSWEDFPFWGSTSTPRCILK